MIPNLKSKLARLPKTEIKQEEYAVPDDFECATYTNTYSIHNTSNTYNIADFLNCNTECLKLACKVSNHITIEPNEIAFFDTETTGLAGGTGTVAFLVGVGKISGDQFVVKQFLMKDYHQESSVLKEFAAYLKNVKAIATYNGKSFDAPLIISRSILNKIELELNNYIHFDLLHACRRVYARRLKRCKLTDIEEKVLNIIREDDIPGSDIPEIFFRYLKYKQISLLDKVIEHNLYDILALAQIAGELANSYEYPRRLSYDQDKFGVAKTLLNMKKMQRAQTIFESMKDEYEYAKIELAYILKRRRLYDDAMRLFKELSESHRFIIEFDIEAAKIAEHHLKNYELAVNYTNFAIQKIHNNRLLGQNCNIIDHVDLRKKRLLRKIERKLH